MKYLKNQRGVAFILEIILVALVLTVVGLAVYASVNRKQPSTSVSKSTPTPSVSKTPSPTPAKPANEFDVPELGFKMVLPDELKGLKYEAILDHPGDVDGVSYTSSSVHFTTKSLETSDSICSAKNAAIGGIAKYSFDPAAKGIMGVGEVKKVGQNYLTFMHPQATCSDNAAVVSAEKALIDLLSKAFDTATPLP